MHPSMVLICGFGCGALASATGAEAWIGGAHCVECPRLFCWFRLQSFSKKLLRFDWSRSSVVLESSGSASA